MAEGLTTHELVLRDIEIHMQTHIAEVTMAMGNKAVKLE